jgi:glycosyltransferase involved in cell wall biosynthesis
VRAVFEQISKYYPDARLVLVGELERGVTLDQRIIVVPGAAPSVLSALYAAADALLFPSTSEGFGLPVIEAQAAGLPVVCSDRGALPEVAGKGALIRSPYDIAGLAAAVRTVLEDADAAADLVAAGRHNLKRFNKERWVRSYYQMWERVARAPPAGARLRPSSSGERRRSF